MRNKSFRRVAACTLALAMTFSMTAFAEENVVVFNDAVEAVESTATEAVESVEVVTEDVVLPETEAVVEETAGEVVAPSENVTPGVLDQWDITDENGKVIATEAILDIDAQTEDELIGADYYLILGNTSINGYHVFNTGERKYWKNASGHTVYHTNVYADGTYQFKNKAISNGSVMSSHNNGNGQAVRYFKYDAGAKTLLSTWHDADDWKFFDVFPSTVDWQFAPVKYCYDKGYMSGTGTNKFDPNEKLDRSMFATVVYSVSGKPAVTWQNIFNDVVSNTWYSKPITWAYNNRVVSGTGKRRFEPSRSVQRQEAIVMLYQYAKSRGYNVNASGSLNGYADVNDVANWAYDAIKWAVSKGIISGRNIGSTMTIAPKGTASRAECAAMIKKFTELYR